jgi:hypothetical protein
VARKAKNRAHLTEAEKEIINRIIVACSAKIYHFLMTHDDPGKYASQVTKLSRSNKAPFIHKLLIRMMNMNSDDSFFPQDLNMNPEKTIFYDVKDVTNATSDLISKSSTYMNPWQVTEALQGLVKEGLLLNVKDKKDVKKFVPNALPKLKKGRSYDNTKREGRYSVYLTTSNLSALNKIISKPGVLKIIHRKLRDFGLLNHFYLFMGLAFVYAIMEDESMLQFANTVAQNTANANSAVQIALSKAGIEKIQYSHWELIRDYLRSIKEEELEGLVSAMIQPCIENPIDYHYTLLAISES